MALLFSEPIQKSYRASRISCSYFFCWIFALCAIILPFFLAFSTNGFWLKRELYEEQPKVLYRKEIFIQAYSDSAGTLAYSSLQKLNELYFDVLSPMVIKSSIIDYNFDDKPDLYNFNVTLYTDPASIRNIKILTIYDYRLRDRVKLDMISIAYADIDLPYGGSNIYLDGQLELKQKVSIKPSNIVRTTYNDTLLDTDSTYQTFLPFLFQRYNERNETTYYDAKPLVLRGGSTSQVHLNMKIRIPSNQIVAYKPQFLEVMKFAWIQYLSLLLPVLWVIYQFARFVFRNQIFETSVTIDK